MKITIIFPARDFEIGNSMVPVMPLAPTLLAALTPDEHEVSLVDMFYGDKPDYDSDCDLVAITVRTPLAVSAYSIADQGNIFQVDARFRFVEEEKIGILGHQLEKFRPFDFATRKSHVYITIEKLIEIHLGRQCVGVDTVPAAYVNHLPCF